MRSPVIALLGPTNTGKTHHALERMLEHRSGMMGFPLRLLARENYDRLALARGPDEVALVTGEERIVPPRARYFLCTVEAMPVERPVAFLAVDEVQLAADRERGHLFTDRLLHARGREETMLLGSDTARPLVRRLLPEAAVITRPRLSVLRYEGPRRLDRLPRRCAVVAFSVPEVYRIAERLRQESGGAALVFGALSPRTRNAQVALFQSGEVDRLVATDAIGMGLNLDIEHVVFTRLEKFDGREARPLSPAEVGQIAGRAGRHVRDGTFSPTTELGELPRPLVAAVEGHSFAPLRQFYWRNPDLDFASPVALRRSLEASSPSPVLARAAGADDHRALLVLLADPETAGRAADPARLRLLWEVAQVPDFRNVLTEAHTLLLGRIFRHLASPAGRLPEDFLAGHVASLDRTDGEVDTLLDRIASIRTWTYVSYRDGWLADAGHWQGRTRAVEDRLSDALHERLTEQFVDRRGVTVAREAAGSLLTTVSETGEVAVQGLRVGRLEGFRFVPDPDVRNGARAVLAAANRGLRNGVESIVAAFEGSADESCGLRSDGQLTWRGGEVARLARGEGPLSPRVEPLPGPLLDRPRRERVRRRLAAFVRRHVQQELPGLAGLASLEDPGPSLRAVHFALLEGLGCVPRARLAGVVAGLSGEDRRRLAGLGVRLGRTAVFLFEAADRRSRGLRALLWSLGNGGSPRAFPDGPASVTREHGLPEGLYGACGYVPLGGRAVRVDVAERLAGRAFARWREGTRGVTADLAELAGCSAGEVGGVLKALGFRLGPDGRLARGRAGRPPAARARTAAEGREP
jgi:ATP-dependent RNA helicase SUPV3L1/SUV3